MAEVLTLRQLAEHLQLSERTLYRLLGRGLLPGFKVGGHWRFRRSVVDYWMDLRVGRMTAADFQELEPDWRGAASLSEGLTESNALLRLGPSFEGPRALITALVGAMDLPPGVSPDALARQIWDRERVASTATEGGVAFLHTARWEHRGDRPSRLLAIGRLDAPMPFGAPDGAGTDVFFLLLAREPRHHLILLARAAQLCRDPAVLPGLRSAATGRDVLTLIRAAERRHFHPDATTPS